MHCWCPGIELSVNQPSTWSGSAKKLFILSSYSVEDISSDQKLNVICTPDDDKPLNQLCWYGV